jgi:hypothetical protein
MMVSDRKLNARTYRGRPSAQHDHLSSGGGDQAAVDRAELTSWSALDTSLNDRFHGVCPDPTPHLLM